MCGVFYSSHDLDFDIVSKAIGNMQHRGPDNLEWKCISNKNGNYIFGHTRLNIVDADPQSNQPFQKDGMILSYNGEIYNYKKLRTSLQQNGDAFATQSDTEVLFYLLRKQDYLKKLKNIYGMYAFVFYDGQNVIFSRDQLGIKPLYYFHDQNGITIASNMDVIKACFPNRNFSVDVGSQREFLEKRYIRYPNTIYSEIKAVLPGDVLRFQKNKLSSIADDKNNKSQENIVPEKPLGSYVKELEALMLQVLDEYSNAHYDCSLLLSGGLDSSLLAALSNELNLNLKCFSLYRSDNDEDHIYTKKIAKYLNLDVDYLNTEDVDQEIWDEYNSMADKPLGCSSCLSAFQMYRSLRDKTRVVITGDGADELFGGYRWQQRFLINKFPHKYLDILNFREIYVFLNSLFRSSAPHEYNKFLFNRFSQDELMLLHPIDRFEILHDVSVSGVLEHDINNFLQLSLERTDVASMAASVEARVPYLDQRVVEFSKNLPDKYKINRKFRKYILLKVAERHIPKPLLSRKKQGFSADYSKLLGTTDGKKQLLRRYNDWAALKNQQKLTV